MKYKAVIFDLDGTLMDSLKDLAISVNHALACMNMPQHTIEEIKQFVGNGARRLIELSVESGSSQVQIEECFSLFRQHYACHCMDYTCLYSGIQELLENLKDNGIKLAIVSNKPQFGVTELYKSFFSSTIDVAIGEAAPLRRKP
ncbi:MAG: HAD hydrolase-like protein, partial [Bacteroidaceae bacterium]|nr:HAD hydrolase-like protein [Bacteroidaceae bacterium]